MPELIATRRFVLRLLLACSCPPLVASAQTPTTYYVRPDGGTAKQCTGKADAPYAGKGNNQPCAWSELSWALKTPTEWRISGGDRLLVAPGSYRMGRGGKKSGWDIFPPDEIMSSHVYLPPLLSGPNADTPTILAGSGYESGCPQKPELWGALGTDHVLDLSGTSNALLACLEITDHATCGANHPTLKCGPGDEAAGLGIYAKDEHGTNIVLRDLDIHGLAGTGINGRFASVVLENVTLAGNGMSGWNADLGDGVKYTTTVRMDHSTVEWNGCVEDSKTRQIAPAGCYGELQGGYGDGIGTSTHGGSWTVTHSTFRYNTQDGLDLLYLSLPGSKVVVDGCTAYGNAGNQIKVRGEATITNNVIIANCSFFDGKPFSMLQGYFWEDKDDFHTAGNCRANGDALTTTVLGGSHSQIVNNTIVGEGDFLMWVGCDPCHDPATVEISNNILRGFRRVGQFRDKELGRSGNLVGSLFLGAGIAWSIHHNLLFNLDIGYPTQMPGAPPDEIEFKNLQAHCPIGPGDVCADPLFVNDVLSEKFDGRLQAGSPAIHAGVSIGNVVTDHDGRPRPQGAAYSLGSFEPAEAKR